MSINIALDIDGVLACRNVRSPEQAQFFKHKGAIIATAHKIYYIFPGVIEFIKLLFQTENIKVSFYSSGKKKRNERLVEGLLKLALGETKYEAIQHQVRILSGDNDDLISASSEEKLKQMKLYDLLPGRQQKDLSKVLGEGELLENAILIDNDSTFAACGQAKNLLLMPSTNNYHFRVLPSKCKVYQPEGYKFLDCVLASEKPHHVFYEQKRMVQEGKQILLLKTENEFKIEFLDDSHQYKREVISLEENRGLLEELNKIHQSLLEKDKRICQIENQELVKKICHLVDSRGGIMKKICRRANRIFYVAGLLFTALKESKSKNILVSESLFRLQFKLKSDETDAPKFRELRKIEGLYHLGLEKLREVNSGLQLITPHHYVECIKLLPSAEEQFPLEQAIVNKHDDTANESDDDYFMM